MMELRRYPNLKLIVSMGAGVDHLLRPPGPPPGIPVARLKDVLLTSAMAEWVLLNVLRFHRQDPEYRALQQRKEWLELSAPSTAERRIGILGIGELGSASARLLTALGCPVMGWSRSAKTLPGVQNFHGADGLMAMAAKTTIVEVEEDILPAGAIDADDVHTPGLVVHRLIRVPPAPMGLWTQKREAAR
jgi:glyoxylate/hydroxypyruvate reductase A